MTWSGTPRIDDEICAVLAGFHRVSRGVEIAVDELAVDHRPEVGAALGAADN